MPQAIVPIAGSVVGGLLSSRSSKKAAEGQQAAADAAAKSQQAAADAALAEQRRQFDVLQQNQAPYRDVGVNALNKLPSLAEQFGRMPTAQEVMADPGYQFGLTQGVNALQGSAAAGGGLYSGAAGKALTRYGSDYATQKYNDAFNRQQTAQGNIWNRYSGLAGIGQTAANQLAAAGQNYANNVGNIGTNNANALGNIGMYNANAQGRAAIAQGNIWNNVLNHGISWWDQPKP